MAIGIDGLSGLLDQTYTSAANTSADALQGKLGGDLSTATDEELMGVCKEFEAYFVEQVLKEIEKTIPKEEDEDASMSQLTDFYKQEMMQSLSKQICSQQDLGLAKQMYEQMKRNYSL